MRTFRLRNKRASNGSSHNIKFLIDKSACSRKPTTSFYSKKKLRSVHFVGLNANKMHSVNSVFNTGVGLSLIREDFLEVDQLGYIQANNPSSLRNSTNQKAKIVGTITLRVRIRDSRVRVVFVIVRYLAVPVFLGTSFIDSFVKDIFPSERKIVPYISKPVPIIAIKDLSSEHEDKDDSAQGMLLTKEEHAPRLVSVVRQKKIPPRSEGVALVATNTKGLVQVGPLLEWESTQAWTIVPELLMRYQVDHIVGQ